MTETISEIQNVLLRRVASKPSIKTLAKAARETQGNLRAAKSELEAALDPSIARRAFQLTIAEAAHPEEIRKSKMIGGASVGTPAFEEDAKLRARVLLNRLAIPYSASVVELLKEAAKLVGEIVTQIIADEGSLFSKWQCPKGQTDLSRGAQMLLARLQEAAKNISNPGPAVQNPYTANYEHWIALVAGEAPTATG